MASDDEFIKLQSGSGRPPVPASVSCPKCAGKRLVSGGTLVPFEYRCWDCGHRFSDDTRVERAVL